MIKSTIRTYIFTAPNYEARLTPLGKDKAHVLTLQGDPSNPGRAWKRTRNEVVSDLEAAELLRRIRAARTTNHHHDQPWQQ